MQLCLLFRNYLGRNVYCTFAFGWNNRSGQSVLFFYCEEWNEWMEGQSSGRLTPFIIIFIPLARIGLPNTGIFKWKSILSSFHKWTCIKVMQWIRRIFRIIYRKSIELNEMWFLFIFCTFFVLFSLLFVQFDFYILNQCGNKKCLGIIFFLNWRNVRMPSFQSCFRLIKITFYFSFTYVKKLLSGRVTRNLQYFVGVDFFMISWT